jgi:hypothetical protein
MVTRPIEIRQRACQGPACAIIFFICRSCDRGQRYHDEVCRHKARLEQRRQANGTYMQSFAAKLDHCDRQRAYRARLKLKKVTGQGSGTVGSSGSMDSALMHTSFVSKNLEQQPLHAKPLPFPASEKASYVLVSCLVCGRSALWVVPPVK